MKLYRAPGFMDGEHLDLKPIEEVLAQPRDCNDGALNALVAVTLRQAGVLPEAMISIGEDPKRGLQTLGTGGLVPVIDGEEQYEGGPTENPDWRMGMGISVQSPERLIATMQGLL